MLDPTVCWDGEQNRRVLADTPADRCERSLRIGEVLENLEEQHEAWIMLSDPLGSEVIQVLDFEVHGDGRGAVDIS
jgi:hypothetical protein